MLLAPPETPASSSPGPLDVQTQVIEQSALIERDLPMACQQRVDLTMVFDF
jgi:hypothetical protein